MVRRWLAILCAVVIGLGVWAIFAWRASQTQSLCIVFKEIMVQNDQSVGLVGTPGYTYYRQNPEELKAAHELNHDYIARLPC